ncbi:MAG: lysophospholipid acyltransferase family protein [Thermodesulfobacteriota bacterium]
MAVESEKKWQERLLTALVPRLFNGLMWLILATSRLKRHGDEHWLALAKGDKPFITSFWHYCVLYNVYTMNGLPYAAMVSASSDGSYVADVIEGRGYFTVRGSRNQKGPAALKGMLRAIKNGKYPVLVADGSQGPAMVAQAGSILLASRTGIPILPKAITFSSYFKFNSWDRTIVPKPFAQVDEWYGEPIHVPAKLDSAGIEEQRQLLEERLKELYDKAWAKQGKEGH